MAHVGQVAVPLYKPKTSAPGMRRTFQSFCDRFADIKRDVKERSKANSFCSSEVATSGLSVHGPENAPCPGNERQAEVSFWLQALDDKKTSLGNLVEALNSSMFSLIALSPTRRSGLAQNRG